MLKDGLACTRFTAQQIESVAPTPKYMLNEIGDYADLFIRKFFSEEDGWFDIDLQRVGPFSVDNVFQHLSGSVLLLQRVNEPIVSKNHVQMADRLRGAYEVIHADKQVRVVLVYGKLLVRPRKLPQGISIMSISDDSEIERPQSLLDVKCN